MTELGLLVIEFRESIVMKLEVSKFKLTDDLIRPELKELKLSRTELKRLKLM